MPVFLKSTSCLILVIALISLFFTTKTLAQNNKKEIDLDEFVQELFAQQETNINYNDLYEAVFQYYRNPLDLNKCDRPELSSLYILSELQLNSFFNYTSKNGKLLSIYELQAIPNFDRNTIEKILPFVTVRDDGLQTDTRTLWQRIKAEKNNSLILRLERGLEPRKGYRNDETVSASQKYFGNPFKLYGRYRVQHFKDFSIGFTFEKDAGEVIEWKPKTKTYGFDFISFHFQVQNKKRIKNLVIGDYQMQFGQGLVLSSGFAIGKGSETITTIRRNNLGIRPYTSALESGFFRGAALTYEVHKRIDATVYVSNITIDGNLIAPVDSSVSTDDFISSIYASGLHRTSNELKNKSSIIRQDAGYNFTYNSKNNNLQIGTSLSHTNYRTQKDYELLSIKRNPTIYNQFEFTGSHNQLASINYSYNWQNFCFFGESARSTSGGLGNIHGFLASLTTKLDISMLYRNYQRNFHTFYGNAFGEATRNINERGLYIGLKYSPNRRWNLALYYDKFSYPWLSFQADAPTQGYEYLARLTWKPSKTITLYAQYREERKDKNQADNTTPIDFITKTIRQNYLFNIDYNADKIISLKTRAQFTRYQQSNNPTHGMALVQDVNADFGKLKISVRMAVFETDSYDTRLYVYEKDVLYSFSIPAYYGKGVRSYLLLNYQLTKKLDCWFRIAQTTYRNQDQISSGSEQIIGNTDTDIKLQLRIKF